MAEPAPDWELAARVFDRWRRSCACDLGASRVECPGVPSCCAVEEVRAWIAARDPDAEAPCYPFDDPESLELWDRGDWP